MTEQTELDPTAPPAGDGLLEPHGLEAVGEAIEVEEPVSEAGGEATPAAPEAAAIPIEAVEEPTGTAIVTAEGLAAEEAAAESGEAAETVEAVEVAQAAPVAEAATESGEAPKVAEEAPAPEVAEAATESGEAPEVAEAAPTAAQAAPVAEAAPTAEQAAPRTVARLIADTLHGAGVKFAFTVPGESFLGILESFGDAGIRVIATRHESGAAFMAEAYGQLTGRPAACLATRAVGASNLAIGIHTARADSTPMFALIGQVERPNQGREAFQEVDLTATIGGLASWAGEIRSPEAARGLLGEATRAALTGRPGPALISCPEDVLDTDVPAGATVAPSRPPVSRPDPAAVRSVIQLLASAERPVIVAGAGVLRSRCSRELVRFAELLGVPVVAAWRRADVFPNDHPLYLGMSGFFASPAARDRLATADALVALGSRLNEPTSLGYTVPRDGLRWAHVDVEPRIAGAGLRAPDIAIESDAAVFLRAAVARLERGVLLADVTQRREAATAADRARHEQATVVDAERWDGPGVHPGRIVSILRSVLPDEAIVTTDAGNFGGWLARGFAFRRPATFLGPTSGAMGYALPAAIAAAIVHRDRPVVAVAGDGGFAMTMVELETAVRERVRPIAIVFDNERYGTIRMHQDRRAGGRASATDLGPIDFARAAEAFGARGVRVETTDGFESALREALSADRPTVLHLPLDRRWVSVDETPTVGRQGRTRGEGNGAASGMQRDAGAATSGSHVGSATVDAEVSAMTEQPQSGSGLAGDRGPADEVPTIEQDEVSATGGGTHPASAMGDPERSERDPGQRPRGDDDWSPSDAGVSDARAADAATSFGPADAPSDPNDVGGN